MASEIRPAREVAIDIGIEYTRDHGDSSADCAEYVTADRLSLVAWLRAESVSIGRCHDSGCKRHAKHIADIADALEAAIRAAGGTDD